MRKGWSFVMIIVVVFVILGAVCMGVGLLTGADFKRIFEVVDHEYAVTDMITAIRMIIQNPESIQTILQNIL